MSVPDPEPPTFDERDRSGWPFMVVVFLVLAVWMSALVPRDTLNRLFGIVRTPPEPRVDSGTAPELAAGINHARRAFVYIDEPTSTFAAAGRFKFVAVVTRLARQRSEPRIRFFVLEQEYADETRAWLDGLRDERVEVLGRRMRGYGGVLWLESGRIVDADPNGGHFLTEQQMEERTERLWKRES